MRHAPSSTFTDATPFTACPAAGPAPRFHVMLGRLMWLLGLPCRVAAIRRDMALLGQMSTCELADIGLTRQDLWDAAALPLGHSPAPLFDRRVAERRHATLSRRR